MNGYFVNEELRRSSKFFLSLMVLFLLISLLTLQTHHERLKADYIKTFGAIASRIGEIDPDLVKEIIPFISQEASESRIRIGQEFLREYGMTTELEEELFPYLNTTFQKNTASLVLIIILMMVVFFTLNYFQYVFFYKRIRRITVGAKRIIEGDYDIEMHEDQEGDFSKLANAFNSMKKIILSQLDELKKEKQFLVDLMADISHQLKTPLSSLVVYNDIMLHKDLSLEQRETFLLKKQDQLERMKWLIYSILKLAKLDAKSIKFEKKEMSLNETVYKAIDALESKASLGKVRIIFAEEMEVIFNHDQLWMEEALINILKNDIEHTPADGQITVHVMENPLFYRIAIEDTGEGIPEAELPKIFKRFYKIPAPKKSDSLGIGLALAKSIIESHNGIIEVQSQINVGTKFMITFLK